MPMAHVAPPPLPAQCAPSPEQIAYLQQTGESYLLAIKAPGPLLKYIARKGSITVNGVSLTVNRLMGDIFEVNLIPHTLAVTTLANSKAGAKVNLEVDMLARYVERLMAAHE